jgi:phosphoribosyl 1,2-cyclic phosphodiesterase
MRVYFCGVRGSAPAPGGEFVRYGGHTSCIALANDDTAAPQLVLDAGSGLRAVSRLLDGAPFTGTIMLTHLHWDHVLELPFFAAGDREDATPTVLVPEQPEVDALGAIAHLMSPPYFPIEPTQLRGRWTFASVAPGERDVEGLTVLARELPHKGGRTLGYRISDSHSTVAYMPDHCPTMLGPGEEGFGEYHPAALELARDADLLIHDAQLHPGELAQVEFGHSVADYGVALARRAGARRVALSHHRPDRTDDALDRLAQHFAAVEPPPAVSVAAEGTVLQL